MKTNQKGFSAVEGILILVIVGLIGGVGWFVFNSKKKVEDTQNKSTQAQKDPQKVTNAKVEESTSEKNKTDNPPEAPCVAENATILDGFIHIKTFGVKIKLTDAGKINFCIRNQDSSNALGDYESYARPTFKAEFLKDKTCEPGVSLYRSKMLPEGATDYKKIGEHYYFVSGGPGACGNDADDELKLRFLDEFSNSSNLQNI